MSNKPQKGQVWSYKTRKSEYQSTLTIIEVEDIDNEFIVHLKIDGLKLRNKDSGEVVATTIEHLPISLEMFNASICALESADASYSTKGYKHWKKLYKKGKAGVWSVDLETAINITEETFNI